MTLRQYSDRTAQYDANLKYELTLPRCFNSVLQIYTHLSLNEFKIEYKSS
jgi:hypothetical protein